MTTIDTTTTLGGLLDEINDAGWQAPMGLGRTYDSERRPIGATMVAPTNGTSRHARIVCVSGAATWIGDCCDHGPAFVPERVEGYVGGGRVNITATWSRQHGCGSWPNIETVLVDCTDLDIDEARSALAEAVAVIEARCAEQRATADADAQAECEAEVAEVLERMRTDGLRVVARPRGGWQIIDGDECPVDLAGEGSETEAGWYFDELRPGALTLVSWRFRAGGSEDETVAAEAPVPAELRA